MGPSEQQKSPLGNVLKTTWSPDLPKNPTPAMRKFDVIRWWLNCIAGYLVLIVLAMLLGWKYNAWQNYAICTDALQEAAAQYGHPIAAPHPPAFSDVGLFIDVMTDDKYKPVEPPPEIPGGRPSVVIPS